MPVLEGRLQGTAASAPRRGVWVLHVPAEHPRLAETLVLGHFGGSRTSSPAWVLEEVCGSLSTELVHSD